MLVGEGVEISSISITKMVTIVRAEGLVKEIF